jgi:hypothetical protein
MARIVLTVGGAVLGNLLLPGLGSALKSGGPDFSTIRCSDRQQPI